MWSLVESWDWYLGLCLHTQPSFFLFSLPSDKLHSWSLSLPPPSISLSLSVRYLSGRVFVLDLISGSQADVDKFIRPGDVIDEINGISLRNSKSGQVPSYLQSSFTEVVTWHRLTSHLFLVPPGIFEILYAHID